MSVRRSWSLLLVILLSAGLLTGCAAWRGRPEPPVIGLAGIDLGDMTLFEQRYQLRLRVQNPNDADLPIAGLRCTLFLNEREFAQGVSAADVTIPRFGEALLTVDVVSDLRRVLEQLRETARTSDTPVSYRLSGKLMLENYAFPLPFDYRGEFDLRAVQ